MPPTIIRYRSRDCRRTSGAWPGERTFDAVHVPAAEISAQLVAHLGPGEAGQLQDLLTRFTYPPD